MRINFQLLVYKSNAQAYENLFVKIMGYADTNFKPVKPHGNIGDRGNDGWCPGQGKYYQVYAPESLSANTQQAIKKMDDDFKKLKEYWDTISPVKEFYFVVNDKYGGVSLHIYDAVERIKRDYNLDKAEIILSQQLEHICFSLNSDIIKSIVGAEVISGKGEKTYQYLVDKITSEMYLRCWHDISDNLFAHSIQSDVIEGFETTLTRLSHTVMPEGKPTLEQAMFELMDRTKALINHFYSSDYTKEQYGFWRIDRSWKQQRIDDRKKYLQIDEEYNNWKLQLFDIHWNLICALNLFAAEVRKHINSDYLMGGVFTFANTTSAEDMLENYKIIPIGFFD